ncbi:MAG TPA: hypothetical protein VFA20_16870 [Myxococcaceae bacterium]|nr:hypothetical protein [Myxococcaceae bacterium]
MRFALRSAVSLLVPCAVLALACQGKQGEIGPQGPPGPVGLQGPKGDTGPAGDFSGTFTGSPTFTGPATFNGSITVQGDAGISGNVEVSGAVVRSGPAGQISVNGIYCGKSQSTTSGDIQFGLLRGYRAAKAICEAACNNNLAHLCSAEEMVRSLQVGAFAPYPSENLWYSTGVRLAGTLDVADCDGWQCDQPTRAACSSANGPMLQSQDQLLNIDICAALRRLACCI